MREIKFRGLGLNGTWFYGNLAIITKKVDHIEAGSYISNSVGLSFAYKVIPETVGQFTGLLDKPGKEIYEGDILSFVPIEHKKFNNPFKPFVVFWNEKEAKFSDWQPRDKVEIIGNIWENSVLIND